MKVAKFFKNGEFAGYNIYCPACKCSHLFGLEWKFNGDYDLPTFSPSLNLEREVGSPKRCHFIVTDGIINYCGDCTHGYRSKSIYMEDYERSMYINTLMPRKVITLAFERAKALVAFCHAERVNSHDKLRQFLMESTHRPINDWTYDEVKSFLSSKEVFELLREICAKNKAEAIAIATDDSSEIVFDRLNVEPSDRWVV